MQARESLTHFQLTVALVVLVFIILVTSSSHCMQHVALIAIRYNYNLLYNFELRYNSHVSG